MTIIQLRDSDNEKVRLVCLASEKLEDSLSILTELMSKDFPSIWLTIKTSDNNVTIGGFYREWNHKGAKSVPSQIKCMEIFAEQIERAAENAGSCVF